VALVRVELEFRFLNPSVLGYAMSDGVSDGSGDIRSGMDEAADKSAGCGRPTTWLIPMMGLHLSAIMRGVCRDGICMVDCFTGS